MDNKVVTAINKFLNHFNKFPQFGGSSVLAHEDCGFDEDRDLKSDDIVVYYDYCTDDCTDSKEVDAFAEWIFGHSHKEFIGCLTMYMRHHGYKLFDEQDGSGNGLYYGIMHFRKIS